MLCGARSANALLFGISFVALTVSGALAPAKAQEQLPSIGAITLDTITVTPTKTPENVWDSLSATSAVRQDTLEKTMPSKPSDILTGMPGVSFQERPDDQASAVTIRGLQDFGRVAVTIDGARQNFQRSGHSASGTFYLEPELIGGADVVRGPVANVYGSGAIGGVVSFTTKDVDDILRAGQNWGVVTHGELGSNGGQGLGSAFAAARGKNIDIMVGGTYRKKNDYKDGDGNVVPNTGAETETAIAKLTVRPMDGHTLKFGYIDYNSNFDSGIPFYFNFGGPAATEVSTIYRNQVHNQIANARWLYSRPDDRLFDFDGNVYWTRTSNDQTKIDGLPIAFGGIGAIGAKQNFTIDTIGTDIHNTSRFDLGSFRNALTVGVDGFRDTVDTTGFESVMTPSGERTVTGGFAQWKANYSTWLEVIGGLRYDNYKLDGGGVSTDGDRLSPKITVGVTPFRGFTPYVTYAEGYRAPALTETLIAGQHPSSQANFAFLPNPSLRPEIGKTKEAGINFKYNDILSKGDAFRAKINVFRNDVDDYIEQVRVNDGVTGAGGQTCNNPVGPVFPGGPQFNYCYQNQNIPHARLEGVEFESVYDTGIWFTGLAASHVRGWNVQTNAPLASVPPDSMTTTIGYRFLERKLTVAARWQAFDAKKLSDIPKDSSGNPVFLPTSAYSLVNLYASYQFNPDVLATLAVENLFDKQYAPYMSGFPVEVGPGGPANGGLSIPGAGITVKAGIKVRFGDDFFKARRG
jgi:hemoglobin/transferrin/lactoferrin receptor protein